MEKRDKITKWFLQNFKTHTDWTGTRVETVYESESVMEVVDKFMKEVEDE